MARILIVDDDEPSRELVTVVLGLKGHKVVACASAEEGLNLVARQAPDLVLMDIWLEGLNGLAATQILKADPNTRHIPVIVTTALAMRGDEERVLEVGCDEYIAKPLELSRLADMIERFVGRQDQRVGPKIATSQANTT